MYDPATPFRRTFADEEQAALMLRLYDRLGCIRTLCENQIPFSGAELCEIIGDPADTCTALAAAERVGIIRQGVLRAGHTERAMLGLEHRKPGDCMTHYEWVPTGSGDGDGA